MGPIQQYCSHSAVEDLESNTPYLETLHGMQSSIFVAAVPTCVSPGHFYNASDPGSGVQDLSEHCYLSSLWNLIEDVREPLAQSDCRLSTACFATLLQAMRPQCCSSAWNWKHNTRIYDCIGSSLCLQVSVLMRDRVVLSKTLPASGIKAHSLLPCPRLALQ